MRFVARVVRAVWTSHAIAAALMASQVVLRGPDAVVRPARVLADGHPAEAFYALPTSVFVGACATSALLLLFRRTRAFAAAFALAVVVVSCSATLTGFLGHGHRWASMGPFGGATFAELAWETAAVAAIVRTLRREGWFPPRAAPARRPRDVSHELMPHWTVTAGGGALVGLAATKIPSLLLFKCPDPWAQANVAMTFLEMWTGLLALFPRTRLVGAACGVALMEGTALFAAYEWSVDASWRGCRCFGDLDAPWPVHSAVAAAVGAVLTDALVLEMRAVAAARRRGARAAPPLSSRVARVLAPYAATGARFPWAPPAAAFALAVYASPRLMAPVNEATARILWRSTFDVAVAPIALLGAVEFVAAVCLARGRRRVAAGCLGFAALMIELAPSAVELWTRLGKEDEYGFDPWALAKWTPVLLALATAVLCVLATRFVRATPIVAARALVLDGAPATLPAMSRTCDV